MAMTRQDRMWVHYPMLVVLYIQSLVAAGDLPGGAGIARMDTDRDGFDWDGRDWDAFWSGFGNDRA